MRSMWGDDSRREIKDRVARVTPDCKAQWGKLSAPQMVCHLAESLKMALGELPVEAKHLPVRQGQWSQTETLSQTLRVTTRHQRAMAVASTPPPYTSVTGTGSMSSSSFPSSIGQPFSSSSSRAVPGPV